MVQQQADHIEAQEVVARIRAGDHAAFEVLFRRHYRGLCRFAAGHVGSMTQAEEIVQTIFFRIWQRHREWAPRGSLRAYLYRAARNEAIKHLQRDRIRQGLAVPVTDALMAARTTADGEALQQELARAATHALAELPERRRLVFLLSRDHGLTYNEIAAVLEISVKTVETHMGRALAHLRERLEEFLPHLS